MIISWAILLKLHRKHTVSWFVKWSTKLGVPDCPNQSGAASYCNLTCKKSDFLSIN